jgi:uncharacterized protein (DUF1800 family)
MPGMSAEPSLLHVQVLERLAYGASDTSLAALPAGGPAAYWGSQLRFAGDTGLPADVRRTIDAMTITRIPARDIVGAFEDELHRIESLPEGEDRKARHKALNERYAFVLEEAQQRHVLRALYSPNQLQEQLTWFWFNHFNVFHSKGKVRLLVADFEESAIRPHVLGRFRDLVLATLMHPAMLVYLDNAQNARDHVNENYARELLELHTLGVDAGYTQKDVEELARILTGVGVNLDGKPPPRPNRRLPGAYFSQGMFAFHPGRHDFGSKTFLGHHIAGRGFDEVAEVVDILCAHPATARTVSRKLALYFLGDDPPAYVAQRMQDAFLASRGDIAHTLGAMLEADELWRADRAGRRFKDPVQYVFSALRFTYDGRTVTNVKPVQHWLRELGEPLYGHQTPDGYGLLQKDWASPGQLAARFEVARQIANGGARLFAAPGSDTAVAPQAGYEDPDPARSHVFALLQPRLSEATGQTLAQARNARDWTALFLSSPEFMYR